MSMPNLLVGRAPPPPGAGKCSPRGATPPLRYRPARKPLGAARPSGFPPSPPPTAPTHLPPNPLPCFFFRRADCLDEVRNPPGRTRGIPGSLRFLHAYAPLVSTCAVLFEPGREERALSVYDRALLGNRKELFAGSNRRSRPRCLLCGSNSRRRFGLRWRDSYSITVRARTDRDAAIFFTAIMSRLARASRRSQTLRESGETTPSVLRRLPVPLAGGCAPGW